MANNKDYRGFFALEPLRKRILFCLPLLTLSTSHTGDYFQGIWRMFKIFIQKNRRFSSQLVTEVVECFIFSSAAFLEIFCVLQIPPEFWWHRLEIDGGICEQIWQCVWLELIQALAYTRQLISSYLGIIINATSLYKKQCDLEKALNHP